MYKFPFETPPEFGTIIDVVPGVKWLRLPLPFRLDHVNIYLLEDGDGWAVIDTGIYNEATIEIWRKLFTDALKGLKLTRIIVTHFHPDHIGMAGWLCEQHDVPLLTSQTSYLFCQNLSLNPGAMQNQQYFDFYRSHGMPSEIAKQVGTHGHEYLSMVSPLPMTFLRIMMGDMIKVGARQLRVLIGDGHAPDQIMLYCEEDKLFFSADQVIVKITPNISVWAAEPDGDPLGHFMRSIRWIKDFIPDDALVLPGHQMPFYGLHARCDELLAHHEERCALVIKACSEGAKTTLDLVPVLFHRELDDHQMSFAFSETLAHINRMLRRGDIMKIDQGDNVIRYQTPSR